MKGKGMGRKTGVKKSFKEGQACGLAVMAQERV